MQRLRICYVTLGFLPAVKLGGPVQNCYSLTTRLVRMGHEVTVVCTNLASKYERLFPETRRANYSGVEVIYFNTHKLLPMGLHSFGLFFSPELVGFCKEQLRNFDIVHIDGYRSSGGLILSHFCLKYRIPFVIQPRGTMPVIDTSIAAKRVFDLLFKQRILGNCSFLVASSGWEEASFKGIVPEGAKVVRIYNGIDFDKFAHLPEKGEFRRRCGITEPYLITYLGRLHAMKGIDTLMRAAAITRCRHRGRLAIIGPDEGFKSRLVALARELGLQESVSFVAPLAGRPKLEAYVDSDLVVYAGRSESFGMVPFEATMCGVPSISSENSACAEILGPLGIGFRVPYGDIRRLADTIDTILETRPEIVPRVRAAAEKLGQVLSWERIAREYEDAYLGAVDANRKISEC